MRHRSPRNSGLSTGASSFPIISVVKLARKQVLLEFLTLVERYWRLSTEKPLELTPKMLLKNLF